jgi:hypothetical protein
MQVIARHVVSGRWQPGLNQIIALSSALSPPKHTNCSINRSILSTSLKLPHLEHIDRSREPQWQVSGSHRHCCICLEVSADHKSSNRFITNLCIELRNQIYNHLLDCAPVAIRKTWNPLLAASQRDNSASQSSIGLTRVCRSLRAEFLPIQCAAFEYTVSFGEATHFVKAFVDEGQSASSVYFAGILKLQLQIPRHWRGSLTTRCPPTYETMRFPQQPLHNIGQYRRRPHGSKLP